MPFTPRIRPDEKDLCSGLNNTGSTLPKGTCVKVDTTTDEAVAIAATPATDDVLGIVLNDIANLGWGSIQLRGLALVLAGGTITKGDRLTIAASGKVITWTAAAGANAAVVGVAKRSAVLNDLFEVELAGPAVSRQG